MTLDILQKFLITMIVFIPLEHFFPKNKEKKIFRKYWGVDTAYALISVFFVIFGVFAILILAEIIFGPIVSDRFKEAVGAQLLILQIVEIIIIADIGYYLVHRTFHKVPFLWRMHAIHHSIEDMDWLAAHRLHPIDVIMTRGIPLMIPLTFGFSTLALAIFLGIFGWHSYLKHSNVNISFGPLRWIFATPTYHHWHHANEEHAFDKNFAGQLPILDIIFGTAIMEESKGPEHYGTDTFVPAGFVDQIFLPFKLLSSRIKRFL